MKRHLATFTLVSYLNGVFWCSAPVVAEEPVSPAKAPAPAQRIDLARHVPPDTLLYFGWSGAAATAEAFNKTAMGRIAAEPAFRRAEQAVNDKLWPMLVAMSEREGNREDQAVFSAVFPLLEMIRQSPTAFVLHKLELGESGPTVHAALLVRAGDQATRMMELVDHAVRALGRATPAPLRVGSTEFHAIDVPGPIAPLCWGTADSWFVLSLGRGTAEVLLPLLAGSDDSLAGNDEFKAMRRKLGVREETACASLFLNLPAIIEQGRAMAMLATRGQPLPPLVDLVLAESGLAGIKSVAGAVMYEYGGELQRLIVHAPAPRKGLLGLSPAAPLRDDDLRVVPADANWMIACNADLHAAYKEVNASLDRIDPGLRPAFKNLILVAEGVLGILLEDDLLATLGDTWVLYDAPSNAGFIVTGATLVVDARDPQKFSKTVTGIVRRMTKRFEQDRISVRTTKHGDHEISFLNFKEWAVPVAPAWSHTKNRLVIALYPQMVAAALDRIDGAGDKSSILDSADFQRVRKSMPKEVCSLSYSDQVRGLRSLYGLALPLLQMGATQAQKQGIDVDISLLPPMSTIAPHLFGSASACSVDDDGLMMTKFGALPFTTPGFEMGTTGSVAVIALLISILLPSLSRARELSKRTVSAANLRALGIACVIYMDERDGRMPDQDALIQEGFITDQLQLHSPIDERPGRSYVFIPGASMRSDDGMLIVAYDRACLHEPQDCEGTNVLFTDGRVDYYKFDRFVELIRETYAKLGKPDECPF